MGPTGGGPGPMSGGPGPMGPGLGGSGIPGLTPPPPALADGPPRRRGEFVVMFVWREPVPNVTPADSQSPPSTSSSSSSSAPPLPNAER